MNGIQIELEQQLSTSDWVNYYLSRSYNSMADMFNLNPKLPWIHLAYFSNLKDVVQFAREKNAPDGLADECGYSGEMKLPLDFAILSATAL